MKKFGIDIRPTSQQLSEGQRTRYIENRQDFPYKNNGTEIGHTVKNENEFNLIKIFVYLKRNYEYEHQYFQLNNGDIVIPTIYDIKRKIFYVCVGDSSEKLYIRRMHELQQENVKIKVHYINHKKYIKILSFFYCKVKLKLNNPFSFNEITIIKHIKPKGKCLICGKDVDLFKYNKHTKYCSIECWNKSKKKYVTTICLNCGKEFIVEKIEKDKNYKLWCSDECHKIYEEKLKNNEVENTYHNMSYKHFVCENCGKEFGTFARKAKYCSIQCLNESKNNRNKIDYICEQCGKHFIAKSKNIRFCSISCASKFNAKIIGFGIKIKPKTIWNKGLTKETDERIAKSARKEAISQARIIREGIKNPTTRYIHGFYKDVGHYVRSGWELNFARILKLLNRKYDYEPKSFILSDGRTYTPDFYMHKNGYFYEIKGMWRKDAKDKFITFKREYPNIKIKLINRKKYFKIIHKFKHRINYVK